MAKGWYDIANDSGEGEFARLNDEVDNVRMMKTWLRTRNVPRQETSIEGRQFLPSRLLDVQAFENNDDVRLVTSQGIRVTSSPVYLALSHCWGGQLPIRLEKKSLKSWMETGIPFSALPKTFRDAARITKQLGIRYLWVDSLCIIQDCNKDWAHEASLMAEVYSNACSTLAALSSKDSSEGCNLVSNIQTSLQSPYVELKAELHRTSRIRIFQRMPRPWRQEYEGGAQRAGGEVVSPLRTRAWVLQEKELSNCTIYFARNQLIWENKGLRATGQIPWEEVKPQEPSETPRMMCETASHQIVGAPQHTWYQLVEDYASRSLTFPPDKLVAFSGLAKAFGRGSKAQYLAGIWSTNLPAALLWQVKDETATRPAYLAPTWSWASLMGSISYDSLRLESDGGSAQYEHPEDIYPGLRTLKVQSSRIELEDDKNPYSTVTEGRITLSGARCIRVQCGQGGICSSGRGQPLTQHNVQIGVFYPDIAEEAGLVRDAYCLALQSESISSLRRHQFRSKQDAAMISMVMGIVLVKQFGESYRRVGLARWIGESLFDLIQPTTIKLI